MKNSWLVLKLGCLFIGQSKYATRKFNDGLFTCPNKSFATQVFKWICWKHFVSANVEKQSELRSLISWLLFSQAKNVFVNNSVVPSPLGGGDASSMQCDTIQAPVAMDTDSDVLHSEEVAKEVEQVRLWTNTEVLLYSLFSLVGIRKSPTVSSIPRARLNSNGPFNAVDSFPRLYVEEVVEKNVLPHFLQPNHKISFNVLEVSSPPPCIKNPFKTSYVWEFTTFLVATQRWLADSRCFWMPNWKGFLVFLYLLSCSWDLLRPLSFLPF